MVKTIYIDNYELVWKSISKTFASYIEKNKNKTKSATTL